jgi:hypothetical protein
MYIKLSVSDNEAIRTAYRDRRPIESTGAIVRDLANVYNVSESTIYNLTADLRSRKKKRSDCGKRKLLVGQDENLDLAIGLMERYKLSASHAMMWMEAKKKPLEISYPTLNKYLSEAKLSAKYRNLTPHCRFEAKFPGHIFQMDISGSKERWVDEKTRRIITVPQSEVTRNHPNEKKRWRLWRFVIVDDYSRLAYVAYYDCQKPSSKEVVDFLVKAFQIMGIPKILYTDNDSIITGRFTKRFNLLVEHGLKRGGGSYKAITHAPGNAKATGKVEVLHKTIEEFEKTIGYYLEARQKLNIDFFRKFATTFCDWYNNKIHSSTKETPLNRYYNKLSVVQKIEPSDELVAYSLADEKEVLINRNLSFSFRGNRYQLPTPSKYKFENLIGNKVTVIFPYQRNYYFLFDQKGNGFEIGTSLQKPQVAGYYKNIPEPQNVKLRKHCSKVAKEHARLEKKAIQNGKSSADPLSYAKVLQDKDANVKRFPKPSKNFIEQVRASAPHIKPPRKQIQYDPLEGAPKGIRISWYKAISTHQNSFESSAKCMEFMDSVFQNRQIKIDDVHITNLVNKFFKEKQGVESKSKQIQSIN